MHPPRTFFDKVWDQHVILGLDRSSDLLAIDRLVLHDMSGSEALSQLESAGRKPARPDMVFTTVDHFIRTDPGRGAQDAKTPEGLDRMEITRAATGKFGLRFFDVGDARQGITHVVATEAGIALPGLTIVCGDSHTCTLGGIGALAWGIGSTEGAHVLATQTLSQSRPLAMRINLEGRLAEGVGAKDLILHLIARVGAQGGIGYAVEFAGPAVRAMPVEGRLTLCNMAVEFSAKFAFVAPDDTTFDYLHGREFSPREAAWDAAVACWRTLATDEGARFARELSVDCDGLGPQVTWGVSPQQTVDVAGAIPDPMGEGDPAARQMMERALAYMELRPGMRLGDIPIDAAYIGSCTNARLSDLREAATVLKGRKVAPGVDAICVPGSSSVKRAAEAEGLDKVFLAAGFEWHESGCGLCGGMGNPRFVGKRVASTTNRNFENRQGRGARTHLASPATVAASAILGRIGDARRLAP